eukprot:765092-Hanusia_phi.AAC.4
MVSESPARLRRRSDAPPGPVSPAMTALSGPSLRLGPTQSGNHNRRCQVDHRILRAQVGKTTTLERLDSNSSDTI